MACPIKIAMGIVNKREQEGEEREPASRKRTHYLQSIVQSDLLYVLLIIVL